MKRFPFVIIIFCFAMYNVLAQQTDDKADQLVQKVDSLTNVVKNLSKRIIELEKTVYKENGKTEKYKIRANWLALEKGMNKKQVTDLLGEPGKILSGFGTFWYYPDSFGGRVEFDDDEKVTNWSEP